MLIYGLSVAHIIMRKEDVAYKINVNVEVAIQSKRFMNRIKLNI